MRHCFECRTDYDGRRWHCPACGHEPPVHGGFPVFAPDLADDNDLFDARSFAGLAAAEETSFWFPPRNRLIQWALATYFPACRHFFELGCGTGIVLKGLAERRPEVRLTGGEVFIAGLRHARDRLGGRAELVQLDGLDLPFVAEFDVAGSFDVIEHIDDDVGALRQLHKALRPGGGLLIIVPRHRFLWSRIDDLAGHKRRYSARELREKAAAAGFELVRLMSFGALTLPLQWVSRKIAKPRGETLAEALELDLPAPVAFGLEKMLALDGLGVRMGLDYPFGASLLLVARKPL